MRLDVRLPTINVRLCSCPDEDTKRSLQNISRGLNQLKELIVATQSQVAEALRTAAQTMQKVSGEIQGLQTGIDTLNQKVAELQAVVDSQAEVSDELRDAVQAVQDAAQAADDLVPDTPEVPDVPGEEEPS